MTSTQYPVYPVGHSNHPADTFAALLNHRVDMVATLLVSIQPIHGDAAEVVLLNRSEHCEGD